MTPEQRKAAFNYGGGVDGAESILLLVEERLRDDGAETVDLPAILGYLGQLVGLAVISRSERPEDGVLARAAVWMVGEAAIDFHDEFIRAIEAA